MKGGLSYTSLSVLSTIADTENCTQKMLCEMRFLPKQTVNAVVTAFYKKGWLRLEGSDGVWLSMSVGEGMSLLMTFYYFHKYRAVWTAKPAEK